MTQRLDRDPATDRIRDAAARWLARIEGRDSPRVRRNLERWLAADPRHVAAYRRLSGQFEGAKILRESPVHSVPRQPVRRPMRKTLAITALAAALVLAIVLPRFGHFWPSAEPRRATTVIATPYSGAMAARHVTAPAAMAGAVGLEDGSVVTLDTGSALDVAFGPDARRVTLLRGRARFEVAHNRRPFTVLAGSGSITARGTLFDVTLDARGQVAVALLRGVVDVQPASPKPALSNGRGTRRLNAGESVGYAAGVLIIDPATAHISDPAWVDAALEFDNVSLGYLLERSSRNPGLPIKVADASLAALRVSGHFDVTDHQRLADNLAALFDLRTDVREGAIELRR